MIPKQMKNQSVDLYRKMQGITHTLFVLRLRLRWTLRV